MLLCNDNLKETWFLSQKSFQSIHFFYILIELSYRHAVHVII